MPRCLVISSTCTVSANAPVAGGTETILVVEDDPAVQSTVVAMLENLGYRVLKADHGEQALDVLKQDGSGDLPGDLPDYDFIMLSKPYSMMKLRAAIDGCTAGTDQAQGQALK
ncbi:hypothetical protein [Noviherbaspirillum sp.]|uniref:hypothetical protein n=1 Tax=Noviherbaspirillum sp. TaxID=1926288 RepID=UPI003FA5F3ED